MTLYKRGYLELLPAGLSFQTLLPGMDLKDVNTLFGIFLPNIIHLRISTGDP